MIPKKTIKELIEKHSNLEKDLSTGEIDKKQFAEKSKEYSDINEIVEEAKKYLSFEKDQDELEKILSRFCILRFTTHGPSQSGKPLLSEIVKRKKNITLFPNQYFSPVDTARINEFCQKEGKLPKIVHLSGPRISKADFIISIIENSSSYKFDYDYTKLDHSLVDGNRL